MIYCALCDFSHPTCLSIKHLRDAHNLTTREYKKLFPNLKTRVFSSSHKNNLSTSIKKSYDNGVSTPPMLGKKHSDESRKKISINSRGVVNIGNIRQRERKVERMHEGAKMFNCEILSIDELASKCTAKCNICQHTFTYTNQVFYPARLMKIGKLCPVCQPRETFISKGEKEILEFIKTIYFGNIIQNDREVLYGKEIDIYLPELNLGIEYTGLYWHSDLQNNDTFHLQKKMNDAKNQNVKLITIFEDEWQLKKNVVKNKLTKLLSTNPYEAIENIQVKEVNADMANTFLAKNNLTLHEFDLAIGLFVKSDLHALLTFTKNNEGWEITNCCAKIESIKEYCALLIKHFQNTVNVDKKPLVAFSDLRWGPNAVYETLGFLLKEIMPPKVWFIYNRHTQRDDLIDNIPLTKRNRDKIYDCGYEKWELKAPI